ncbi:MAG: alpha/beta fold hydrolase [Woeseiaceae bacterium]|nr:alpha/beta fold hydrolase [Woeseiaceae bacterium]
MTAGYFSERWSEDAPAVPVPEGLPYDWPNRSASSRIDAGGLTWHVQRMGAGPPLLLLHGTAASTHTWRDLMPLLAADYDVLAMDLPGHGYSERRNDGLMTLPALSSSVSILLDVLDFRPRFAVGHSAGAAIALRLALDGAIRPELVIGLNAALLPFGGALKVVFSPLARMFANTRLMPRMVARRARDLKAVKRVLVGTGSTIDEAGIDYYQRLLQREGHVAAVLAMMASWDLVPLLDDLPTLDAQLHLVAGERDKAVSPSEADAIARVLPSTEVTRLADCGHLAHEEQPARIADLIRRACGVHGDDDA